VQSFWFGSRLPPIQLLSLRSFIACNHEVHLFAFDPIENTPTGVSVLDASAILPRDSIFTYQRGFGRGSPSAFSNLFRYKLLHDRGGWWVDTDVVCLKPFDFADEFVFASERRHDGQPIGAASCVIKSPAGAAYLDYCLEAVRGRDTSSIVWGEIGPRLVDAAIQRFDLGRFVQPPDVFNPVDYSAFEDIQAPGFDMLRLREAFGVHLWNQKWNEYRLDQNYEGAPDSLYAWLRQRYLAEEERRTGADALHDHLAFLRQSVRDLARDRDQFMYANETADRKLEWLEARVATLEREAETLRRERDDRAGELNSLKASTSWKVTAPLRALADRASRRRPR
jgi:hypothetical protein